MGRYCYACFVSIKDGEGYEDYKILDQIGVFMSANGAYNALKEWANFVFSRSKTITEDDNLMWVFVNGTKYFVSLMEFHEE